jgi:hypothetical protein
MRWLIAPKIDDLATNGLAGVNNSLAYRVHEIEKHFHNVGKVFGFTTTNLVQYGLNPVVIIGGQQVWGTELMIYDGTTIESGSSVKKFDLHELMLTNVSNADRPTYLHFMYGSTGTPVAATIQTGANTLTKSTHGLSNGTKIMLSSIVTSTGINAYTTYYVVNQAADTFQIALTLGGAAVDITGSDGTCNYAVITASDLTEILMSASATNADALPYILRAPRATCNQKVWCRGMTTTANTNTLSFYVGLHVYDA